MEITRAIFLSYACSQFGAIASIWRRGLFGAYPFFTALLFVNLLQFAVLLPYPPLSMEYYKIYSYSAWLVLVLQIAAACEGWTISTHLQYPKIGRVASWLACYATIAGVAAAFMVGLASFDILSIEHLARLQTWHVVTARYVSTALFFVCALGWTLNSWITEGVSENCRRHIATLAGIFGVQAVGFLLISNYRSMVPYAGVGFIGCQSVLFTTWAVFMTRRGECPVYAERIGDDSVLEYLPEISRRILSIL